MGKSIRISGFIIIIAGIIILLIYLSPRLFNSSQEFSGQLALEDVKYQVDLGARTPGSEAHLRVANWIMSRLEDLDWQVNTQETVISNIPIKNIIARRGMGTPWIIISSHYDTRIFADSDLNPENQKLSMPGANDGASSVAILLELARVIPTNLNKQIWLVFFDAEDNYNIPGYAGELGSQYFVNELTGKPDRVVLLDMVGDRDLNIFMERNSDPELNIEIWDVAAELGYSQFIPSYKHAMIDDHIPFIRAGIRAVDVIDFDYPYWHTAQDTIDKISADSLKAVGETILKWLEQYPK
jgi:Zn-dependent M28 family amino/carboxypeptidase